MEPVVGGALLMFCMSVKPMYATMAMTKIETTATIAELEELSSDIRVRGKNPAYAEMARDRIRGESPLMSVVEVAA
jgi:hypothetical protein